MTHTRGTGSQRSEGDRRKQQHGCTAHCTVSIHRLTTCQKCQAHSNAYNRGTAKVGSTKMITLRYSPVCSKTYTRRFSVPLAQDLMTNSQVRPPRSFTGKLYDLQTNINTLILL